MKFKSFLGKRGTFSVAVEGETHNVLALVFGVQSNGQHVPIEWRLNEQRHSPTGHEWGYGGSGPAQLAWCILRECGLTKAQCEKLYQKFKAEVITGLNQASGFEITTEQIMAWVSKQGPGTTNNK